jgi:hypothetical protein
MNSEPWIHQEDFDRYVVKTDEESAIYVSDNFWDAVLMVRAIKRFYAALKSLEESIKKFERTTKEHNNGKEITSKRTRGNRQRA